MNKYEMALNWLCDQCFHLKIERGNRCEWVDKCKHVERLKKLVEKSTPKKPVMLYDVFGDGVLSCPHCKQPIRNVWSKANYEPNACHCCGQAFDWREENEKN